MKPYRPALSKAERDERDKWLADEQRRIERQRTLWTMVYDTSAKDRLKEAMLSRVWQLLDSGQAESADAILEFLPEKDADRILNEFFGED